MINIKPTPPSFLFCYWKPWEENSNLFESFLEYRKDTTLSKYQSDFVGQYVKQASHEQVMAIGDVGGKLGLALTEQSKIISEKFELGVKVLSHKLSNINVNLLFINDNLSLLLDQQKISNLLLENICELLRVPDSEKERQHSIELGLKFFVNAQNDEDMFDDALEELLKAERLMRQDYFVLHRIGLIYLYSKAHFDPAKALDYFTKAAKYASVESDPQAARLANALTKFGNQINSEISKNRNTIASLASDSYNKAAFVNYVLGDFNSATLLQSKAVKFNESSENYFMLAKYHARSKQIDLCIQNLCKCLDKTPEMLIAVFKDVDLINEPEVLKIVEEYFIINKEKEILLNENTHQLIEKLKNKQTLVVKTIISNLYESKDFDYSKKLNLYNSSKVADIENWSFNNLDVSHFRNGDIIPEAYTNQEWLKAEKEKQPAWCNYNNDPKFGNKFGKLYNWYAVNDYRCLAPDGWHIPSLDEWNLLKKVLDWELEIIGRKKNKGSQSEFYLTKVSGLKAYQTPPRIGKHQESTPGEFYTISKNFPENTWWSATEKNADSAYYFLIDYKYKRILLGELDKGSGIQVLLVRD